MFYYQPSHSILTVKYLQKQIVLCSPNLMKNQYLFVCSLTIVINVILSGLKPIRYTFYDKCVGNKYNLIWTQKLVLIQPLTTMYRLSR